MFGKTHVPGGEEENVQEGGERVSSDFSNVGLFLERVVKERGRAHFLSLGAAVSFFALPFLDGAGNIESHLDKLVDHGRVLLLLPAGVPVCRRAGIVGRKLDRNLVLSRKIGVRDLREGDLEGGFVGHVEMELGFRELGLAPVPALQRVLPVFEVDFVVRLQSLLDPVEVLFPRAAVSRGPRRCSSTCRRTHVLLEAVQLDDPHGACVDLHFVALGRSRPLRRGDFSVLDDPRIAARSLPAHPTGGESAFPGESRKVQIYAFEGLVVSSHSVRVSEFGGL